MSFPFIPGFDRLTTPEDTICDRALASLRPLARAALATLPGTSVLIVDDERCIRLAEGPGWDSEFLAGRPLHDVVEPLPAIAAHWAAALAGDESTYDLASPIDERASWTRIVPLRRAPDAPVAGALALTVDVTDRELRSARRDATFFALSPIPTIEMDTVGTTLRANAAFAQLLRTPLEELVGRKPAQLVHPDDADEVLEQSRGLILGNATSTIGDCRWLRGDGTILHGRYHLTIVRDAGGRPERFFAQFVDDTERRTALIELEQRVTEQSVVARLGDRALEGIPLGELFQEAVDAIAAVLGAARVAYSEVTGDEYCLRAGVGWPDGLVGFPRPVVRELYESLIAAAREERVFTDVEPELASDGLRAGLTVVVGDPGAPLGVLGAYFHDEREYDPAAGRFMRSVGHVLATAAGRLRAEERALHDSLHDSLTGLPNRELLRDRLQQALARLGGPGSRLAVLLLDLDDFGLVNDGHGHGIGDELLGEVATRLRGLIGPADTIARFGGDEFAIVAETVHDENAAEQLAQEISRAFAGPFAVAREPHFVSVSLGVVVASGEGTLRGADELLRDADAALHRAKERGRGTYELFDPLTRARVVSRIKIESELRAALERDELRVEYQPYFDLTTGKAVGAEALVRWQHPSRGLIPPGEFIPIAEHTGLVVPLGEWVLRRALTDLAVWRAEHDWALDLGVTVNVSARQVHGCGLCGTIASLLAETGVPATRLGLEITEGLLLDDSAATRQALVDLSATGARLLLDDFGTGYSSLSYLSRFPVDALKIDRAFVHDLGSDAGEPIVAAIVGLAHALGIDVIAEGIETEEQAERLRAMGCARGQGFHLARPLQANVLVQLLSRP
jgi:diguanylate cyclase (GGDEF)-like protein/PAS domain S-box-containing protein